MRLHHLEVQAFGPFATSAEVDFDHLSEAGLFLLSGATGAGKTSVLDAVCFALYGDVPGDRSSAKRLRSDQAAPGLPPRVTLEATLGGRRFRLVRSPAWERPKKRGTGTTTEQARVTVSEHVGGTWQPLTSRLDEAGDLVARVTGLTQTQFTQVAMLPQGRFQAFLRARSDDRHRLLQQLFRTGRFEAVERWLADRRRELARRHAEALREVDDVVSRAAEAAGTDAPGSETRPDGVELTAWLDAVVAAAESEAAAAGAAAGEAAEREAVSRTLLERARVDAERTARLRSAADELARLEAAAEAHATDVVRLDAARRAAGVRPLHGVVVTATCAAVAATERAADAVVAVGRHLGDDVGTADLPVVAAGAADVLAGARAFAPRADRLAGALDELVEVEHALDEALTRCAAATERRDALPARIADLRARAVAAADAATRAEVLRAEVAALEVRAEALARADVLAVEVGAARTAWLDAREQTLSLQEHLVVLQHARLEGMAAELAGALAVGGCCPVCGSADHPHRAVAAPGAPDAAAERAARSAVDDAAGVETALDDRLRGLQGSLAAARGRGGDEPRADVDDRLARTRDELRDADASAADRARLSAELLTAESEADDLDRELRELATRRAVLDGRHAALVEEVAGLRAEHDRLVAGHPDLGALVRHHERTHALCSEALRARADESAARTAADDARATLVAAAADAGFTDAHEAVAAALDRPGIDALAQRVVDHDRRVAALREVLAGAPDAAADLPDLDVLEADHRDALDTLAAAGGRARVGTARAGRLAGLRTALAEALAVADPLGAELRLTSDLAAFVEGRSSDNLLRMRLSAYVLAYRLSQVVDAANERLARMSDQRYSLEHTGHRGAGETRGGLSLLVRDDWSGESRDPATLSGGETFVVSLALALGLADVIAHEAGGASLDTLFVDEGFGSLDADTLDDVMSTLDALRDGGRVVGVVSHVAEMRDRIPTRLVVTKSRTGSTLTQH